MELPVNVAAQVDSPLANRIASLIAARQAGARDVRVADLTVLSGGNARSAWSFEAAWTDDAGTHARSCVLLGRVEPGQLQVDARREFDTLSAVASSGLPAPMPLWLDEDGAALGMPGLVMERGSGRAGVVDLLKPDSTITRPLVQQLIRLAARLHALDWRLVMPALAAEGDPAEAPLRVLQEWQTRFVEVRMEPLPALASVFGWLRRNLPALSRPVIVHGDLRLGNFLHDGAKITLLLDWEMAHLGDPVEDLAWTYRRLWSPEAFLSLDECMAVYREAGGGEVDPRRLAWYRIFSEAKFAVISLTAARNYLDGRTDNLRLAARASTVNESLRLALRWIEEVESA